MYRCGNEELGGSDSKLYCHGLKFSKLFLNSGFEADFPQKVRLKMQNLANYNSTSHLLSVSLQSIGHFNQKMLIFCRHNASFEICISKVQNFRNFELLPMYCCSYQSGKMFPALLCLGW